jgi:hypothetical protein
MSLDFPTQQEESIQGFMLQNTVVELKVPKWGRRERERERERGHRHDFRHEN